MWVRGSCFSTCARPRVTLPYIHSLLDIPPTLSSYIVHIRIFIYIYKRRQLNFSCAYTWPHADSYAARDACPRVSLSLSMLLRIGCNIRVRSNVYAWCAHVCMNVRVCTCVCVCGGRLRCEETTERVRKKTGTGLSSAQGKTGLEHDGSRTMGARLSPLLPFSLPSLCNPLSLSLHPIFLRPPCALGRVLSSSLARPPRFCPFPSALKRWSTGALTLLDDRPTINTPAGPYFRPRNRHFRTSLRFLSSRPIRFLSNPRSNSTLLNIDLSVLDLSERYIYISLSFSSCSVTYVELGIVLSREFYLGYFLPTRFFILDFFGSKRGSLSGLRFFFYFI